MRFKTTAIYISMLASSYISPIAAQSFTLRIDEQTAEIVAPVLNAAAMAAAANTDENRERLNTRLQSILDTHSRTSDESLAILLGFSIGERPAEDISCELIGRGTSVLSLLLRYEQATIEVPGADMARLHASKSGYAFVEKQIRLGKSCSREP